MLRLVSRNGGSELPVSMAEMAQHLKREDTVEDDEYIEDCLLAAIDWAERFSGIIMVDSTFDLFLDAFPANLTPVSSIYLGRGPLLEVQSVTYRDVGGASTTLGASGYLVDYAGGSIYLPISTSWPTTDGAANAVRIRFRAGCIDYAGSPGPDGDIPHIAKRAIKVFAAYFYANRDNERLPGDDSRVPQGAELLMRMIKIDDSLA